MKKFGPNTFVEAHPPGDVVDVGAEPVAELGNFVDESDFGREERVGGVFDELRRFDVGDNERSLDQIEGE